MAKKIFRNIFCVAMLVLCMSFVLLCAVMYDIVSTQLEDELRTTANNLSQALSATDDDDIQYLKNVVSGNMRITLIDADGTVLYDNQNDVSEMDNHKDAPEVYAAFQDGTGQDARYSETMLERMHYYAVLLENGRVLRVAISQSNIWSVLFSLLQAFVVIILAVLILSSILANRVSRRIIKPINNLDLNNPLSNDVYEELSPLLTKIARQNEEINRKVADLSRSREEFNTVLNNMNEGLIVINAKSAILAANNCACSLFRVKTENIIGKDILALSRKLELKAAADNALAGTSAEQVLEIRGRSYTLFANPVMRDNMVFGAVILILDVTERRQAEHMRQEFSANVSHELKTPLQSISGYAEIIKNGLVKNEDIARFVEKIYAESQRMIDLVDDIMRLSRLDEGRVDPEKENVSLLTLCNDVKSRLAHKADRLHIRLSVSGDDAEIYGSKQILDEIVYNLIDNAIKYNKENGSVSATVAHQKSNIVLSVSDTGIGMADEHFSRVFERFYRVDRSRSREVGGTGLGLSIVKHGAAFHNATVDIKSEEGHGTTITVTFPLTQA